MQGMADDFREMTCKVILINSHGIAQNMHQMNSLQIYSLSYNSRTLTY